MKQQLAMPSSVSLRPERQYNPWNPAFKFGEIGFIDVDQDL
jgi:hypothetical protein